MADIKRIAHVATGWGLYTTWSWIFDNPLWIFVIGWFGFGVGSVIMIIAAVINNFIFLILHQNDQAKWLGVNGLDILKEEGHVWAKRIHQHKNHFIRTVFWIPAHLFKFIVKLVRKNNILAFIALSIETDSFIATAFLRGNTQGKLRTKDYLTFIASTILSCFYWSLRNGFILIVIKMVWSVIQKMM
jgi:hypothetical protein